MRNHRVMRRLRLGLAGAAATATLLSTGVAPTANAAGAGGPPLLLYHQHGFDAQAGFTSTVGSLQNSFFINADTEQLQYGIGSQPTRFSEAVASLSQFDTSTGTYTHYDFCIPVGSQPFAPVLPDGALSVARNLGSATLHATLQCSGFGSVPSSLITVDLAWSVGDPKTAVSSTSQYRDPTQLINVVFEGKYGFNAQAAGTVSDGVQNFTPTPSEFATVFRFGTEQIAIGF